MRLDHDRRSAFAAGCSGVLVGALPELWEGAICRLLIAWLCFFAGCGGVHIDADIHPSLIPVKKPDEQPPPPRKPRPWRKAKPDSDLAPIVSGCHYGPRTYCDCQSGGSFRLPTPAARPVFVSGNLHTVRPSSL